MLGNRLLDFSPALHTRFLNFQEFTSYDEEHNLGFLRNEKRFNVAITRAKALLIVVGCAKLLKHDKSWGAFLRYCVENKSYGAGLAWSI